MLQIYRFLTIVFFPLFVVLILFRKIIGKEDSVRFKEKIYPTDYGLHKNSDENLIWFHGASIGEITSVIPIINEFIKNKKIKILITTTTLSSGKMVDREFKNNIQVFHRYFPIDVIFIIKKFLNIWKPKLIILIDSEIWPNLIFEIKKKKINLILINGRITEKTFKKWNIFKKVSKKIFESFDLCLASSKESFEYLKHLGANNVKYEGNLKFCAKVNNTKKLDAEKLLQLEKRRVWCATSTHEGEEKFCMDVHKIIKKTYTDILTIIIPRHIIRTKDIFKQSQKLGLKSQILNKDDKIEEGVDLIIINSYGLLSKYYDYCKSVFIGKSIIEKLKPVGGQNPIEAARYGCKVYHGPFVYNFKEVYEYLNKKDICFQIEDKNDLAKKIILDLQESKIKNLKNIEKIHNIGDKILEQTINEISNYNKL